MSGQLPAKVFVPAGSPKILSAYLFKLVTQGFHKLTLIGIMNIKCENQNLKHRSPFCKSQSAVTKIAIVFELFGNFTILFLLHS